MLKIESLLLNGVVNLYATTTDDEYVLVVATTTMNMVIPCVKTGKTCYAYIDTGDIELYDKLEEIINAVFDNEVYKGIYKYKPIKSAAPAHDMTISAYIPGKGTKSAKADDILVAAGYKLEYEKDAILSSKRDYSDLIKNAEAAAQLKADTRLIESLNVNFSKLPTELQMATKAMRNGSTNGVILTGPTGTGKSFATRVCAVEMGAPTLSYQITAGTCVDDLLGTFVPDDTGTAKWRFVMGPLLKAYTEGYALIIEEVNFGNPGVLAVLNQYTDFSGSVTVNGTVYKKHPNFVIFMTMNPGYDGTEILNVALKNRFAIVDIPALTMQEYTARCMAYSKMRGHQFPAELFNKLFAFSATLEKEASTSRWHENVKFSIRNAQRLIDMILQQRCDLNQFSAAVAVQYLNALSVDNDNSVKLTDLKVNSEDIKHSIADMFAEYDFKEIKLSVEEVNIDDLFIETTDEEDRAAKAAASKKAMEDELFEKFGI